MRKIAIAAVSFCLSSGIAGASTIDFLGMGNYESVTLGGVQPGSVWAG